MIRTTLWLRLTLTIPASADQQVIYPPSAMPRVDMHTHIDAKTQYAKCVAAMDQRGGTLSITLAGLFWDDQIDTSARSRKPSDEATKRNYDVYGNANGSYYACAL